MMTPAAQAVPAVFGRDRAQAIAALAISIPLLQQVMHRRAGDFWPGAVMTGGAVAVTWFASLMPPSPVSCTGSARHCGQQQVNAQVPPRAAGLVFVLPAVLALAYKARPGDTRGSAGTRPPARRRGN